MRVTGRGGFLLLLLLHLMLLLLLLLRLLLLRLLLLGRLPCTLLLVALGL